MNLVRELVPVSHRAFDLVTLLATAFQNEPGIFCRVLSAHRLMSWIQLFDPLEENGIPLPAVSPLSNHLQSSESAISLFSYLESPPTLSPILAEGSSESTVAIPMEIQPSQIISVPVHWDVFTQSG